MGEIEKRYGNADVEVTWEPDLCIHTGVCLRALPAVFDTSRRPWIQVDGASAEEVMAAVAKCPTGALQARAGEGHNTHEPTREATTVRLMPNGPAIVRGPVTVTTASGAVLRDTCRAALCRCGHSTNPPFCDNSHRREGWREQGSYETPTDPIVPRAPAEVATSPEDCGPEQ
jgi:uncharacterized Fe-S cluster protein YjdI/CDGSH-type Zn-finger protein